MRLVVVLLNVNLLGSYLSPSLSTLRYGHSGELMAIDPHADSRVYSSASRGPFNAPPSQLVSLESLFGLRNETTYYEHFPRAIGRPP